MRPRLATNALTYGLLAAAAALSFVLPEHLSVEDAAAAPGAGVTIRLPGIVRDFEKDNADFAVLPSAGTGHYPANVALTLSSDDVPAFVGGGFKAAIQWRDKLNNPLAPHLYRVTFPAAVSVKNSPTLANNPIIDTFYSDLGPYGGSNVYGAPQWVTNSPMPALTSPSGLPAVVNEFKKDTAGTTIISGNRHYNKFEISNGHVIQISGAVVMQVNETFKLQNVNTKLELLPGATFTLYVKKDAYVQDSAQLHLDSATPERVYIYSMAALPFTIQNKAKVSAIFVIPTGTLHMQDQSHVYGRVMAMNVHLQNQSGLHIDVGSPADACGSGYADVLGAAGASSSGGIPSAASFQKWFRDTPGSNLSQVHEIELVDTGGGIFEFASNQFHPIDNMLFGNQGDAHNNYFTYSIAARFVYDQCAGQFFEFEGADDVWVFIDGDLAIDLGGVVPGTRQYVGMDRLGLTDGKMCSFHFFYAQRNSAVSQFRMRTNLPFVVEPRGISMSSGVD